MDGRAEKLSDRRALLLQGGLIGQRSSETSDPSPAGLSRVHWGYLHSLAGLTYFLLRRLRHSHHLRDCVMLLKRVKLKIEYWFLSLIFNIQLRGKEMMASALNKSIFNFWRDRNVMSRSLALR